MDDMDFFLLMVVVVIGALLWWVRSPTADLTGLRLSSQNHESNSA